MQKFMKFLLKFGEILLNFGEKSSALASALRVPRPICWRYDEKLKESCEAKAPSFEERETRRKAEIEGLQTALAILDGRDIAMTQLNRGLRR